MKERTTTVLLVDDDARSRRLLSSTLAGTGFEVWTASDGEEALATIEVSPPDLLLLDLEMPGLNGAEVCRRLRASTRPAVAELPVIMLTGHSGEAEEIGCLHAGANDFVTKPVGRAVLVARIETHLRLSALRTELRFQNDELARWRAEQEADLAAARTTQQAIIPARPPQLDGWEVESMLAPLIQVGGDVYGWHRRGDGRWLFWLADATGHGAAAALFTTLTALLFYHAGSSAQSAGDLLSGVNREFCGVFRGRSFMTACCVLIDEAGGLEFAGAGHPPLLVRRANGEVEELRATGTILGINEGATIENRRLQLAAGDVALLYSDGLFDLHNASGERCSPHIVAEALGRCDLRKPLLPGLLEGIQERADSTVFEDDVSAIALRRVIAQ